MVEGNEERNERKVDSYQPPRVEEVEDSGEV